MIAAIEWIPSGRADPAPAKYEYSRAEREFLERAKAGKLGGGGEEEEDGDAAASEGDWEDMDDEEEDECSGGGGVKLPKVDLSSLPADLRMDEYSDDGGGDGEEDAGGLLVGKDAEMAGTPIERGGEGDNSDDDDEEEEEEEREEEGGGDDDGDDSDEEDDLADIPDTREYMPLDVEGLRSVGIGGGDGGYTAEELRNMTMNGIDLLDEEEEDDSDADDADDVRLRDGDALLVVAKAEEDFASLEVNVFDTSSSNLYVHHDVPLPSFPLCLALGGVSPSAGGDGGVGTVLGNYVAVGSFEPGIEIWNLDVMNALEPTLVLGGADTRGAEEGWMRTSAGGSGGKKKRKKKSKRSASAGLREGSHADAVMGLSWNAVHANVLASGSADGTVKLWDVASSSLDYVRPSATLSHHSDKVPSLAWHPSEGTLLATGGYDRNVCLVDARSAAAGTNDAKKARLSADCEALAWDPHHPAMLTVATEDGVAKCWDVRKFGSDPLWSMVAHEYGGVSDICYNPQVPGMLVTCSIDKTVALWDTRGDDDGAPSSSAPRPCGSKDMSVGRLHSVSCHPSLPWLLACGGGGNELAVWDMEGEDAIMKRFAGRLQGGDGVGREVKKEEPDFEAVMAARDGANATEKALEGMNKSKKKRGKKKGRAHKRK